jgi:hypothetical protein
MELTVKVPVESVVTAAVVPGTDTTAPATGAPDCLFTTLPLTLFCASSTAGRRRTARSAASFFIVSE